MLDLTGEPTLLRQTGGAGPSPGDGSGCYGHRPNLYDQGDRPPSEVCRRCLSWPFPLS